LLVSHRHGFGTKTSGKRIGNPPLRHSFKAAIIAYQVVGRQRLFMLRITPSLRAYDGHSHWKLSCRNLVQLSQRPAS
jgi:hypothetical protein